MAAIPTITGTVKSIEKSDNKVRVTITNVKQGYFGTDTYDLGGDQIIEVSGEFEYEVGSEVTFCAWIIKSPNIWDVEGYYRSKGN